MNFTILCRSCPWGSMLFVCYSSSVCVVQVNYYFRCFVLCHWEQIVMVCLISLMSAFRLFSYSLINSCSINLWTCCDESTGFCRSLRIGLLVMVGALLTSVLLVPVWITNFCADDFNVLWGDVMRSLVNLAFLLSLSVFQYIKYKIKRNQMLLN